MASTQPTPPGHLTGYYHTVDPNYGTPPNGGNHVFVPSSSTYGVKHHLGFLLGGLNGSSCEIADSRGSLLLLCQGVRLPSTLNEQRAAGSLHSPGLVVCQPGTQRYKRIPCPDPEDLEGHRYLGLFLLDGDETSQSQSGGSGGHLSLSNFRVMAALLRPHVCEAGRGVPVSYSYVLSTGSDVKTAWSSVFSSSSRSGGGGGGWHVVKRAWSGRGIDVPDTVDSFYFAGRANGSLYWGIQGAGGGAALALDEATAGFSMLALPESTLGSYERCSFRVIGGKDGGELRVVRVIGNDLKVFSRLHGSGEWAVEGLVRLPEVTRGLPGREDGYFQGHQAVVVDAHEKYVLLTPREKTWLFSVVLETMEVERAHDRNKYAGRWTGISMRAAMVMGADLIRDRGRTDVAAEVGDGVTRSKRWTGLSAPRVAATNIGR